MMINSVIAGVLAPPTGPVGMLPPPPAPLPRRGSMGNRKRSLTGITGNGNTGGRKSDSDRELTTLVPVGVALMEQVAMDIGLDRELGEVKYVMTVHHLKTNATWRHVRSFEDYRRCQQRLLRALNHGHSCSAECPWLYTFLKSYFPKKHLFNFATSRVVGARKEALARFFTSLQGFLLNRNNHGCNYAATAVASELVSFVYGDYAKYYQLDSSPDNNQRAGSFCLADSGGSKSSVTQCPTESATSVSDDEDAGTTSYSSGTQPFHCSLCDSSLDGEAYAVPRHSAWEADSSSSLTEDEPASQCNQPRMLSASAPARTSSSPTLLVSSGSGSGVARSLGRRNTYYVTTLGCGHQFHDECIVPKLNETLRCPTCDHLEIT